MKLLGTKTLESERLILRKFKLEDANEAYLNWCSDPLTSRYLAWDVHESLDVTKRTIENWINEYENNAFNFVVELKESHELIGAITCVSVRENDKTAEIGYCYGSKFWGHGYATEALRTLIEYLLVECEFNLVEARHISGNPASGKVMAKAGMRKDGVLRERRLNKYTKKLDDMVVYSIKKNEL